MMTIHDRARWFAVHLANATSPSIAARRLGVRVDELARVCAGFPVRKHVAVAIEGAFSTSL